MKKYIYKITLALIIMFSLTGCYTVIWSPDMDFPTEENYYSSEPDSYYYYTPGYDYYYDYPWWLTITPPSYSSGGSYERDRNTTNLRNAGGRNNEGETGVNNTAPPLRNPGSDNSGAGRNSSGSSGSTNNDSRKATNSTDTSTSTSNTSSNNSGESRSTRDDSGGRNNGNGRR